MGFFTELQRDNCKKIITQIPPYRLGSGPAKLLFCELSALAQEPSIYFNVNSYDPVPREFTVSNTPLFKPST